MRARSVLLLFLAAAFLVPAMRPATAAAAQTQGTVMYGIAVDEPAHIKTANVLFDVSHADFAGDVPVVLKYMLLMTELYAKDGTKAKIIGVFYADGAYFVLNDALYNDRRGITTGNPYKGMIAELQKSGVQFEICVKAMQEQSIRREDLLPGVKVNGGANLRMVQLMQEGFAHLVP